MTRPDLEVIEERVAGMGELEMHANILALCAEVRALRNLESAARALIADAIRQDCVDPEWLQILALALTALPENEETR